MILYLLNKSQKAIKAFPSEKLVEAKYTEGINEASKLTFSVPLEGRLPNSAFFALFQKPDSSDFLLFKINDETIENDRISYTGVDAAYDELKSYSYVKDIRPVKRTAKEILQRVLQGTRWEVGYIDSTGTMDTNFYYQPCLECIQKIAQLFNMEVVFTYGFDSKYQVITSRKVNLYQQQGQRTGKRFEYGSNLLTVTREEDSQDIVTALVGRGKGEEKTDEETGEATGGYGRRINFSNVVWSKANGDPADKPAGQEYVEDVQATKIFGYDDGKPRIGIVIFEDIEDPVELLKATWASLKSSDRPKVTFKASVTDVGNLGLGDTIAIIRHELEIEYFTRVFKVTHDLLDKQNNTVEMGDDLSSNSLTSYISNVDSLAQNAQQQATNAAVQAGSKNKNYYSTTKPKIADEGDNLFLNLGNGDFEYWVWHNHQWEFIQSTKDLHNVEKDVKEAQEAIQANKSDLQKSTMDFNASNAKLSKDVVNISQSVGDLQKSVTNNTGDISTLKQTAQGLQSSVKDNSGKLVTVTQAVDGVRVTAEDGLKKATELSQTVSGLQARVDAGIDKSEITQLKDQIDLKVSKGDVLSEINLEAGTSLIKSKKIYLDSDSVVFSGKAFIPDAAITNISADKITAGTLDAGKINVININADNITSGILNGTNSYFDLNQGILNVRNSKDESVFLKDGNLIFSAFKNWKGYSDVYGEITMNTTKSLTGVSEGMLDISSKNGFAIRDQGIEMHDNTSDKGWEFSGEGALIWAYSPKIKNTVTGHSLTSLEINAYDSIRIKTGRFDTDPLSNDWTIPTLVLSNYEGITGLSPSIYMQAGQVDIAAKNFIVTLKNGGESTIFGNFTVTGSKNAVVPTSKGMVAINAYETAEYYFGDIGKAKTDENGQVLIQLDPLFLETVNTLIPYHVFVSPYGDATVWVDQMDRSTFLVKSNKPNIEFSWEIKAKRLGYENNRLKITQKEIPKNLVKGYKEKGIL